MTDQLSDALTPVVGRLGLDLYDLELQGTTLVVTVDRPGGVDLEALASATGAVSRALDDLDPVSGRYTLEVTSPGLERRLRTPTHYRRAVGEEVTVRTRPGTASARRLTGTLVSATDDGLRVEGDDVPGGGCDVAYDDVERARTVFRWGAQPAPSPSRGTTGARRAGAGGTGAAHPTDPSEKRVTIP